MEATNFVNSIRKSMIEDNLIAYKEIFEQTSQVSDPYWKEAVSLFSSLDASQKSILYRIIRQVEVDTVSTMLGILDGTTYLNDEAATLKLMADDDA